MKLAVFVPLAAASLLLYGVGAQIAHAPYHGTIRPPSGGGGGGCVGLLCDMFTGTVIDVSKWDTFASGSGTVSQNNGLTVSGDGTWGHASVRSVQTFNRALGDLTVTVKVTDAACDNHAEGAVGFGDIEIIGAGKHTVYFYNFGSPQHLEEYYNNSVLYTPSVFNFSCAAGVQYTINLLIKSAGGTEVNVNGITGTSGGGPPAQVTMPTEVPAMGTFKIWLGSYQNSARIDSITVTQ